MPSEGYVPKSPDLSSFFSAPAPVQQQQQQQQPQQQQQQQLQVPPYQQHAHQQHLQPQYQPQQQGFYQPPPQHQQQPPHNSLPYLQSPPQLQPQPQPHPSQPVPHPYYNAPGPAGGGGQAYGQPPQPEQHHQHQQSPPRYGTLPQHQQPQHYQGYGGSSHYQQPGQPQYGPPLGYPLQPPFPADSYQSAALPPQLPQQPHHQYNQAHVSSQQHHRQQQLELKLEEIGLASPSSMPPRRSAAAAAAAIAASAAAEAAEATEAAASSVSPGPPAAFPAPAAFTAPAVDPRTVIAHSPVKTKFPTARIKRIMQADEEVGKVSQQTPIAVGKALELFMVNLVSKSAEIARSKNSKRVTAQMLKQVVESDDQWDFLRDIVKKIDPDEKHGRGPRNSTSGAGGAAEGSAPGGGTRLKLDSDSGGEEQPKKRGRPGRKKKP